MPERSHTPEASRGPEPSRALGRPRARRLPALGATGWIGLVLVAAYLLVATVGRLHGSPTEMAANDLEPPSWQHPFGTDHLGRDLLSRTAEGAWTSLWISVTAIGVAVVAGTAVGVLAGWRHGGRLDGLLMRTVESVQALPQFIFVMVVIGLIGTKDMHWGPLTIGNGIRVALAIGVGFVPYFARVARAATVVEVREDYVANLRGLGVPPREILFREVLVNVMPPVLGQAFLAMAIAVFAEGGLSYLGLGVPAPHPTLGNIVADAGGQLLADAWWYAALPGAVLASGILGFNLLGEAYAERDRNRPTPHPKSPEKNPAKETT
ncbi:ABC transporter permease [Yinghuangia sp. ASG 101]|uniref:ABC transporter permease n=1 Tax=Yinghuangia sp. ASG 101 TaxID=2896848 RepID=UPI001E61BF53|nr:ABC transporter permease [Yinghuangia sp. ASG 101]UGQ13692.1 ABC transporter permease [Yinghuangia sp. ASG 101]